MNPPEFLKFDPCSLHLPTTRLNGADPVKLQRQIAHYGASTEGIPPILVYRGSDGALIIFDGVTRASRIAKLRPTVNFPVIARGSSVSQGVDSIQPIDLVK